MLIRTSIAVAALSIGSFAFAQMTPVDRHTIDDNTKEIKSEIVITESGGIVSGKNQQTPSQDG